MTFLTGSDQSAKKKKKNNNTNNMMGWCRGLVEWILKLPRAMPVTIYDMIP